MKLLMWMSQWMWTRYVPISCMLVQVFYGCQGLLDEGDSSMEDGEVECEVSVSVKICCVMFGVGWW